MNKVLLSTFIVCGVILAMLSGIAVSMSLSTPSTAGTTQTPAVQVGNVGHGIRLASKSLDDAGPHKTLMCSDRSSVIAIRDAFDKNGDQAAFEIVGTMVGRSCAYYDDVLSRQGDAEECVKLSNGYCVAVEKQFAYTDDSKTATVNGFGLVIPRGNGKRPNTEVMDFNHFDTLITNEDY